MTTKERLDRMQKELDAIREHIAKIVEIQVTTTGQVLELTRRITGREMQEQPPYFQ